MLTFTGSGFDSLLAPLLFAGGCMLLLRGVAAVCARVTAQRDKALIALASQDGDSASPDIARTSKEPA